MKNNLHSFVYICEAICGEINHEDTQRTHKEKNDDRLLILLSINKSAHLL